MHAIPTLYGNALFRSRLEARYAVVFNGLGLQWEYEAEGYRLPDNLSYLPDFWLPQVRFYVEVKPNDDMTRLILTDEAYRKGRGLVQESHRPVLFLDGRPRLTNYWAMVPTSDDSEDLGAWAWMDVDLFNGHRYHITEHRLYMSTGLARDREHVDLVEASGPGAYADEAIIVAHANGFRWNQR